MWHTLLTMDYLPERVIKTVIYPAADFSGKLL